MKHRCAVCWNEQTSHEAWFAHATEAHDAVLAEFGFEQCRPQQGIPCPGLEHAKRLRTEGTVTHRTRPEPQPFTARDGTVYTPLPLDGAA